jgi:hypothetical protein
MAQQPLVGHGLIIEVSRSHSGTLQSVGLHKESDEPDADLSRTTYNAHKRQTSMPSAGFEPAVSSNECPQIHSLDRTASMIGPCVRILQ